jgi:hypothetical protein
VITPTIGEIAAILGITAPRQLAGEIGISRATLNRFERSSDGMSAESLATMICWLVSKERRLSRGTR